MRTWLSAFAFLVASLTSGAPALTGPQMNIDIPPHLSVRAQPFWLAGWAIDTDATSGTGIGSVQVWGYPNPGSGEDPIFFGVAAYGAPRPDVGATYGEQFTNSSWALLVTGQPAGVYEIHVYAFSTVTGTYNQERQVTVTVLATNPRMSVDIPQGATALQPFNIAGWAIDVGAAQGTGVDVVQVWAQPIGGAGGGGADQLLGDIAYGGTRPDVGTAFGSQFTQSGYGFTVSGLPAGRYRFTVWARSTVTGTFNQNTPFEIEVDPVVATPSFSPAGGTYTADQSVVISTATAGAVVRYTTDGSAPTTASPEVPPTLTVDTATTIRAKAFRSGWIDSSTATAAYVFQAAPPTLSVPSGTYGAVLTVSVTSSSPQAVVRYTTDGSDPTISSPVIPTPYTVDGTLTLKAAAFRAGWTPSPTVTTTYVLQPATPVFSVAPGQYSEDFYVAVNSTTPSTTRRYTTDGSDPTASSPVLGGNYYVGGTVTVKVKAFRAAWTPSATATASYVLQPPPPTASPAAGTYNPGQQVTLSVADVFATIFYTTDGTTPTTASPIFSPVNPLVLSGPITLRARAFRSNYTPSTELNQAYVTRLATPTVSPMPGQYQNLPFVSINSTNPGAIIRYTIDRSDPDENSPVFNGMYAIPFVTIRGRAYLNGWAPSAIVEGTYWDFTPPASSNVTATLTGAVPSTPAQLGGTVQFQIGNGTISTDPLDVFVYRNGVRLTGSAVQVSSSSLTLPGVLADGKNRIEVEVGDQDGLPVYESYTIWAGSRTLTITAVRRDGTAISGALATGQLVKAGNVLATGTTNGAGQAALQRLPSSEAIHLTVTATGFRAREVAVPPTLTALTVELDEDTLAFEDWGGWTVATSRAWMEHHTEASVPLVPCSDCQVHQFTFDPQQVGPLGGGGSDFDLLIDTKNLYGPQTVSRTVTVAHGTSEVKTRFRFQSDELWWALPGRPYYPHYNDWFTVRARPVARPSEEVTFTGSVNQLLASGQFDSTATTPWYTLTLPVQANDTIELTFTVANAVDNGHLSILVADFVQETTHRIAAVELRDLIDLADPYQQHREDKVLTGVSLSAMPVGLESYGGYVKVHGTLKIEGPAADKLTNVWLEVWDNGQKIATGQLARASESTVRADLLNVPFGSDKLLEVSELSAGIAPVLFEFLASDLATVSQIGDTNTLVLQVHATVPNGVQIVGDVKRLFKKFVVYPSATIGRFGASRDLGDCAGLTVTSSSLQSRIRNNPPFPCGGDSWGLPSTIAWAQNARTSAHNGQPVSLLWNDFSNMNGGFFAGHSGHRDGLTIDGFFEDYVNLGEREAKVLLAWLNIHASEVERVYVGFSTSQRCNLIAPIAPNNAFYNAIKGQMLSDKRLATGVIRNQANHCDHFDVRRKVPGQ